MMAKKMMFFAVAGFCLTVMSAMFTLTPAFAADQPIELTINDHNPEMSPPGQAMNYWAKKVEELCGGRVKMNIHHGGALLKGNEAFRGVQKGIAHAGYYVLDRQDGFLLNTVVTLPFMGWPSQRETGQIYMTLMKKFPELSGEWKGLKIIGVMFMPPTHIHTVKKVVKTPEDIKGMKLHCSESGMIIAAAAAGATAVELDIADMYMGLDRGLLQGVVNHFPVLQVFGVVKLLPYHTIFGDGGICMVPMMIIMNSDKFNSLPPDIQKIIADSGSIYSNKFLELDSAMQVSVVNQCKEWKHTFTYLSPEEIKVWYDLVKEPVHNKWIQEAESKGLPGKAVYEETAMLIDSYRKK